LILKFLGDKNKIKADESQMNFWFKKFVSDYLETNGSLNFHFQNDNGEIGFAENPSLLFGSSGCIISLYYFNDNKYSNIFGFLFLI